MENTDGSKSQLSVKEMRAALARAASELSKMQAAIEVAEAESVANIRESVLANIEAGITPGTYMVVIGEDPAGATTCQVTRAKSGVARTAAPRTAPVAGAAPTTNDADEYWTPGLSRGAVATEIRRLFYGENQEIGAIATALGTSSGAVTRALAGAGGSMAEVRAKRAELNG